MRNEALRIGQIDMHDQFVRRQGAIQFRVIARQTVELRERFGMSTFTGLADGLRPTIAWYREAYRDGAHHAGA